MTSLFEVTRAGLVERRRTARSGFPLVRESVSWFVIRPEGAAWDITQEGLPFDRDMLTWIGTPDQRPTFRTWRNLALVDFAHYSAVNVDRPEYVRVVVGRNLLITIDSPASAILDSIVEQARGMNFSTQPVVEDILYNVVVTMIASHADNAASMRRFVNDLAMRVDSDISSVEVREIAKAKMRLDGLTYVLEEESISLAFTPNIRWRGRSDRVRLEFSRLQTSLRSLEASMDHTRSRLDAIHHQYELTLQEASNTFKKEIVKRKKFSRCEA